MNKVFETLENFALVLIVVLGGFMTGFGASLVSSSPRVITPESLATSSSVVDYSATTSSVVYSTNVFDVCVAPLVGFSSSSSTSANWSTLTSSNSNYNFYSVRFAVVRAPSSDTPNYDSKIEFYFSFSYNSSEYLMLNGYSSSDSLDIDGLHFTRFGGINYNSATGVAEGSSVPSTTAFKSQSANLYTRLGLVWITGRSSDNSYWVAPSLNWVSRECGNYTSLENPFSSATSINTGHYNWFRFTDSSGFSVSFAIPVQYYSNYGVAERPMYYLNYSKTYFYDGSSSDNSDSYYNQGFYDGKNVGYTDGFNVGYSDGSTDGYNSGYNTGYNTALTDDHYTFINFLGAVVDAPVQAFRSLFDLEILGVNMLDFFSALLSICIVLLVVKFVFLR